MPRQLGSGDHGQRKQRGAPSESTKEKRADKRKKNADAATRKEQKKNKSTFLASLYAQQQPPPEPTAQEPTQPEQAPEDAAVLPPQQMEEEHNEDIYEHGEELVDDEYFYDTWEYELDDPDPIQALDEDLELDCTQKFMDSIIKTVQERLSLEKKGLKALDSPWLHEHLKQNDWWIRGCHAKHILKRLKLPFSELPYYKDIFCWMPEERWGREAMPVCPTCKTNDDVSTKGFRYDTLGRRVVSLDDCYFCISRRYICKACQGSDEDEKEQYQFMAWNETSLKFMQYGYQYYFPAFLTHKGGIDKAILDLMRPLCDKGLRLNSFQNTLLELHSKKFTKDHIKYNYYVKKILTSAQRKKDPRPEIQMFNNDFNDRKGYDGFVPSRKLLKDVYIKFHQSIKDHLDIEVKKRGAIKLFIDFSFKVGKHLWQYQGERLFQGLCTALNEIGECRIQFNTVTEDHEQMIPALEAFKETTNLYGQPHVELVTSDNPRGDKQFFQSVFQGLIEREESFNAEIDEMMPTESNVCTVGDIPLHYQKGKVMLQNLCENLYSYVESQEVYTRQSPFVIGFDLESAVERNHRGRVCGSGKTATLQFAYKKNDDQVHCNVIQLAKNLKSLPNSFKKLVKDERILFVGVNVSGDFKKINRDFPTSYIPKYQIRTINLGKYARKRGLVTTGTIGLQDLVSIVLNEHLSKDPRIRFSNWFADTLNRKQLEYAALDAIKGLELYNTMKTKADLSIRLTREEAIPGVNVDVVPSHGNVVCMSTRIAEGVILNNDRCIVPIIEATTDLLVAGKDSRIVKITKVHAPSYVVPGLSKANGDAVTLQDYINVYGKDNPFIIRANVTMLKPHINDDSILATPVEIEQPNQTQPINQNAGRLDAAAQSKESDNNMDVENTLDSTEDIDGLDEDVEEAEEMLHVDEIAFLITVLKRGETGFRDKSLWKSKHLSDVPHEIRNVYSSVLGDPFHYMDRPRLPSRHCYRKLFKIAFRDALLAWNPTKLKEVMDALKEDGFTDEEIQKKLYYDAKFFKDCVERIVLPPKQLYWRLRAVFMIFGDLKDPKTKKPLFNDAAWKKANNILQEVLEGLVSDPPGVSFYVTRLNSDGSEMVNKYGFTMLESIRGSNRTESYHKGLITTFGDWVVGVEMSDCLIRERRHRHNHNVSVQRRPGFPDVGHYDTWLIDELQLLVESNFGVLLYSSWSNSSDFKSTPESLGTVALHYKDLSDAVNELNLDMKKVKLTSEQQFMADHFGTKLPFLPFTTVAEKRKYIDMMLETQVKDENQHAIEWCKYINGVDIFPKLPVHFRMYKKQRELNQDAKEGERKICHVLEKTNELNKLTVEEVVQDEVVEILQPQAILAPRPQALHNREITNVGDTAIHHRTFEEQMDPIAVQTDNPKKRVRGKDRNESRKKRRCGKCLQNNDTEKAEICRGKAARLPCQYYL